ncbi:hypothetical protein [Bacillus swezeyi]
MHIRWVYRLKEEEFPREIEGSYGPMARIKTDFCLK